MKTVLRLDIFSRENKNKYQMAYFETLVLWGVFGEIITPFLPVGNTYSDKDQPFSTTACRLRSHHLSGLRDLHYELSHCFNECTNMKSMYSYVNLSGLCDKTSCLNKLNNLLNIVYSTSNTLQKWKIFQPISSAPPGPRLTMLGISLCINPLRTQPFSVCHPRSVHD